MENIEPIAVAQSEPGPEAVPDEAQAFILKRARSEVHLLLDNISASPDVTLAHLMAAAPPETVGLPPDWIEKVCEITWPPSAPRDIGDTADQAALLIKARDYLNGLAKPASGATIAFTLLVTQGDERKAARRSGRGKERSPSRASLAAEAYPDLVDKATGFHQLLWWTLACSAFALIATLALSWYLAIGNAALADFTAARTELARADAQVGAAQAAMIEAANAEQAAQPATPATPATAAAPQTAAPPPAPARPPQASRLGPFHLYPCNRSQRYQTSDMRDACLARTMAYERWEPVKAGLDDWSPGAGPYSAAWFATLFGSGILPVLYGFLGAIAAVVRTLSSKIKASLLSPRDVQLTFQQLALGTVIGACISLFIGAPATGESGTALLGPVTLSASAISFVAGFGVDSVFQALEALISRIFNIAPAGMGARAEQRPPA